MSRTATPRFKAGLLADVPTSFVAIAEGTYISSYAGHRVDGSVPFTGDLKPFGNKGARSVEGTQSLDLYIRVIEASIWLDTGVRVPRGVAWHVAIATPCPCDLFSFPKVEEYARTVVVAAEATNRVHIAAWLEGEILAIEAEYAPIPQPDLP